MGHVTLIVLAFVAADGANSVAVLDLFIRREPMGRARATRAALAGAT